MPAETPPPNFGDFSLIFLPKKSIGISLLDGSGYGYLPPSFKCPKNWCNLTLGLRFEKTVPEVKDPLFLERCHLFFFSSHVKIDFLSIFMLYSYTV